MFLFCIKNEFKNLNVYRFHVSCVPKASQGQNFACSFCSNLEESINFENMEELNLQGYIKIYFKT